MNVQGLRGGLRRHGWGWVRVDRLAYEWFQWQAQVRVLRLKATAFQDHFNDVMEVAHPGDFIRVRPAGSVGDRKCDGYLRSTDTVFQVYAPKTVVTKDWISKINDDFAGAKAQWVSMRGWTFVHNDHDGIPPDVAQTIIKIDKDHPKLTIDQWPPNRVCGLTTNLDFDQLERLFGKPPTEGHMRSLNRGDIATAVAGLAAESHSWHPGPADLRAVDARKIDYNELTTFPRTLLTAGMTQAQDVDDYFANHLDPTLRDRTAAIMKDEWQRLQAQGVVGDDAFHALHDRVTAAAEGSRQITAAIALMAYLFESCDIFDNPPSDWPRRAA